MEGYLFTPKSVTEGHPDKLCNQIFDAILDETLQQDPAAHVICEKIIAEGVVIIMGEITANYQVNLSQIARNVNRSGEYSSEKCSFDADSCKVFTYKKEQSADITLGVNHAMEEKGSGRENDNNSAGDQGMMFGYACNESTFSYTDMLDEIICDNLNIPSKKSANREWQNISNEL